MNLYRVFDLAAIGFGFSGRIRNSLKTWWARQNSNLRPLPCQGSAVIDLQALLAENKRHTPISPWLQLALAGHFQRDLAAIGCAEVRGFADLSPGLRTRQLAEGAPANAPVWGTA